MPLTEDFAEPPLPAFGGRGPVSFHICGLGD